MQEIQSSGETDPEIWKDCQVRSTKKGNVNIEHSNKRVIDTDDIGGEATGSFCEGGALCVVFVSVRFELSLPF